MRMNEGCNEEEGFLIGICVLYEVYAVVADPLSWVYLCGELRDLRNIVHIRSLPHIVKHVFIGRIADEIRIIVVRMRKLFLRDSLPEAHSVVKDGGVVHLSDRAGVIARIGEAFVKALTVIRNVGVIIVVARASTVLSRLHAESRRHANGRRRVATVKYDCFICDAVKRGGNDVLVAQGVDRICALLIGKDHQNVFTFHNLVLLM